MKDTTPSNHNVYGLSGMVIEKQRTENASSSGTNIEDSIGIVGNSISKASKLKGVVPPKGTNKRIS